MVMSHMRRGTAGTTGDMSFPFRIDALQLHAVGQNSWQLVVV